MGKQLTLHWFRKNLRLHDNPALCEGIKGSSNFLGVYVLPPFIPDANISANKWFFLLDCLKDLDCSLRKLGSQLLVVQGYAGQVIPQLLRKLNATKLTFEKETEPFGQQRDVVITRLAESAGVEVVSCGSHTLFDVDQVVRANHGCVPTFFDEFVDVVSTLESPDVPVETVRKGMFSTSLEDNDSFHGFHIPTLEELGIDPSQVTCAGTWQGGETAGLRKLENVIQEMVDNNFEVKSIQQEFLHSSCGTLSPFLRFGCLSARLFYHSVAQKYLEVKGESPPMEIFQSLLWRDFLFTLGSQHPTLNKMEDNPLCLQIKWETNPSALKQWKMGKTGFPFIDAIMRQLCQEGWISEIARHIVGCFLTRGCLWISWEEGFKLFGELQLDAEWSPNAGSWMMFSGSAFFYKNSNIFCAVEDARKIDPSGDYIRKYLPEVRGLPTKYLFEPWKAPASVQEAAGCVVGKDYPSPIVDYREQRRVCVQRLKELAHSIEQSSSGEEKGHTSLHWFRKDLRLHDNPTLVACLQGSSTFYPVYVLDTAAARQSKISANRWNFLLESLQDLDGQLKKLGSRLFVVRGRDVEVLPKLLSEWGISRLSYESDSEPHGAQRDAVVRHIAEKAGVEVLTKTSHTLYEPGQIVHANRGIVPMLFEDFVRVVAENKLIPLNAVKKVDKILLGSCITPVAFDHQRKFGVPALNEVGVKDIQYVTSRELWRGGETEALRRLGILEQELVKNEFGELPLSAGLLPSSPTHLSPYLRFGCLSPRMMFEKLTTTYEKAKDDNPPVSFYEPLLLREFFFLVASVTPGLQKMNNNPVCVQYPWEENAEGLERWKNGTTGFPWIDAVMRQLRLEGWIPHFAREAVGCFLTRGCLWINWEEGYKVFDELQLDAEWSLNAGNWLWLSCSTFVKDYVPWYCPVEVGKKADPTGEYVRKYVPEVKGLPTKYIFEPWTAPVSVQKASGCVVGKDYPSPLVDHKEQRRVCVQRLKELAHSIEQSSSGKEKGHTSLHWFRKDLRLHDNPTLVACLQGSSTFYPVYVLDTAAARQSKISANRWNFLLESLQDLDGQLKKLGSRLFVVRGRDVEVLPKLLSEWGISRLSYESDSEPHGAQRDAVVRHIAEKAGVEVLTKTSHTLYEPGQIVHANRGIVPMLFEDFVRVVAENKLIPLNAVKKVDKILLGSCITPVAFDHQRKFGVPALNEVGVKDIQYVTSRELWRGGETEALRRLGILEQELVKNEFGELPLSAGLLPSSPTHLSPYLRFGCLSPRMMFEKLTTTYEKAKDDNPPVSFYEPLLLREFFFLVASVTPGLQKMNNNPVCVQYPWEENAEGLERWKNGTTGFPWIDAVMRQLRLEGWIPHFAREAVGCFLTRGCLWINWEEGYKVFDELQLDAEWSLNAGNWLWLSCSTFVKDYVPWYCPVEVGKKADPTGEYVRKYVPEVKGLPTKYIFKPWTAPVSVQKAAGCVVGKDYPSPLVDHKEQRRVCVQRLKELAYSIEQSSSGEEKGHTSLHWFRKDLRLHDNPTLVACLQGSSTFYPVYVLDTAAARQSKISANRWNFLLESLQDLDGQLKKLGSRLFVVRGRDVEVLPKLLSEWGISRLSYESDSEPHGAQRDAVVRLIAEKAGVEVLTKTSHTLYEPGQIVHANRGIVPMLFEDFVRVVEENKLMPRHAVRNVDKALLGSCITPVAFDHQRKFGVPALSEVGVKDIRYVTNRELWRGGETEALRRLGILEQELVKNDFGELPLSAGLLPSSPTHMSPYLRFGCLSPRMMFKKLTTTYEKVKDEVAPVSVYEPLLLREFFFLVASVTPGLQKMNNNPVCVQYPWEENAEGLERWKNGTTGFPWIDAVMRQLRLEGWIPHFAREAVGCFLTRGCLWINWEEGYKVFDELQLDAEWSLNAGNWLWLSGSTFVRDHVPWYCPVEVGKKVDPSGEYIRKYVPEVKHLPDEYLHEPWKAPVHIQKAARCKIGDDYPEPVADHIQQREICVRRLKEMCISLDISGYNSIHWFRKDLRLHDNPALVSCLADSRTFYGVYFLEHGPNSRTSVSNNRWKFLVQSLHDLDSSLARCGSRLFVMKGRPIDLFPSLFREWNITRLSFETETEPRAKTRDFVIADIAKQAGVEVINRVSHTLYDVDELLLSNGGIAPQLFNEFEEMIINKGRPELPAPTVNKKLFGACITPVRADHNQRYGIPGLEDLAVSESNGKFFDLYHGGEQKALVKLEAALKEITKNDFCYPPISAAALMPSPTHLSPYLRLGCLSVRLLYQRFTEQYIKKKGFSPSVDVYRKLLWREFFFTVASQTTALHEMANNPLCLEFPWEDNPDYLVKWKQGLTGFPWIDAIMRQLTLEGWIHDVARKAVGLFLTRGCLWINWQEGVKVFDELQLDAEWSLNAGNWLWLSGSTFVRDHVPWYCPVEVGKKVDPTGEYVRKYVPEVRQLPLTYLFEPWLAPRDVQESSKCVIGQDYPYPIVDHVVQRDVCVQRLKELAIKLTASE